MINKKLLFLGLLLPLQAQNITEDFSDDSPEPYFEIGSGSGTPTYSFNDAFTITSGNGSRIYLSTKATDYALYDFEMTADVVMTNTDWSATFFGFCDPVNSTAHYGEPIGLPQLLLKLEPRRNSINFKDISVIFYGRGDLYQLSINKIYINE